MAELRGIAKGLRPSILDDLGLVASISQLLSDVEHRNPLQTSIGVIGVERRLDPSVELALFRVAQEALSNVERHAEARRVDVGLDFNAAGIRLLVRDDGIGLPPVVAARGRGAGLAGTPGHGRTVPSHRRDLRHPLGGGSRHHGGGVGPGRSVDGADEATTWSSSAYVRSSGQSSGSPQLSHDRNRSAVWRSPGGGTIGLWIPCHRVVPQHLGGGLGQSRFKRILKGFLPRPRPRRGGGGATGWRSTHTRNPSSSCSIRKGRACCGAGDMSTTVHSAEARRPRSSPSTSCEASHFDRSARRRGRGADWG